MHLARVYMHLIITDRIVVVHLHFSIVLPSARVTGRMPNLKERARLQRFVTLDAHVKRFLSFRMRQKMHTLRRTVGIDKLTVYDFRIVAALSARIILQTGTALQPPDVLIEAHKVATALHAAGAEMKAIVSQTLDLRLDQLIGRQRRIFGRTIAYGVVDGAHNLRVVAENVALMSRIEPHLRRACDLGKCALRARLKDGTISGGRSICARFAGIADSTTGRL